MNDPKLSGTILVSGANGFLGSALVDRLRLLGRGVKGSARQVTPVEKMAEVFDVGDIGPTTDWAAALQGVDSVIHCAARVHVMREQAGDPLELFRHVNTAGTLSFALQAADRGVRRFVFVSSLKVNGEATAPDRPFTALSSPAPQDAYGISKWEAEKGLQEIAAKTGMEVVIVRPPLVYGPGVKANFASLMRVVQRGVPLPLGAATVNRRSLVALDNLVDLLITCTLHPAAPGGTFLVSDGEDLSTTDLIRRLSQAMGKPARLLPVPPAMLMWGARLAGKGAIAQRLLGSLQADISHTRALLGWTPPVSVDEGLRQAVGGMAIR